MFQKSKIISVGNLLIELKTGKKTLLIDVRSEKEFEEDHVPGAVNLPVLTNKEREEVGTLYKKNSFEARRLGARLIAQNVPGILKFIENNADKDTIIYLYCWRGGMRSKSLFTVLDLIGYKTFLLDKGYKAYRRFVYDFLKNETFSMITIYGPSGSGKTALIESLRADGLSAVNIENLASHKGSLLGGDFETQPSQKKFESLLVKSIIEEKLKNNLFFIVEGESRKIGKINLPFNFYSQMINGKKIWIELPLKLRAKRLAEEYENNSNDYILNKVLLIKKFISKENYEKLTEYIKRGDKTSAAEVLLESHYDNYYYKRKKDAFVKEFNFMAWEEIYKEVKEFLSKTTDKNEPIFKIG
ncbi:MAG: tRNA 2-selenouridine(34) synthase MnmH [Spirochaetia bacterium]|nr:tRNA 2-selenouridine(34) synthase MnmH [Spirochaetia bacterium]